MRVRARSTSSPSICTAGSSASPIGSTGHVLDHVQQREFGAEAWPQRLGALRDPLAVVGQVEAERGSSCMSRIAVSCRRRGRRPVIIGRWSPGTNHALPTLQVAGQRRELRRRRASRDGPWHPPRPPRSAPRRAGPTASCAGSCVAARTPPRPPGRRRRRHRCRTAGAVGVQREERRDHPGRRRERPGADVEQRLDPHPGREHHGEPAVLLAARMSPPSG